MVKGKKEVGQLSKSRVPRPERGEEVVHSTHPTGKKVSEKMILDLAISSFLNREGNARLNSAGSKR